MIYLQLFISFFQIGILSFGGGYAAMPLIEKQVIDVRHWMSYQEFTDPITIDELTPGPIAINAATFVGTRIAGPLGAVCATLGNVAPCCIIALILAKIYSKYKDTWIISGAITGLRCMVVALIANSAITIMRNAFFTESSVDITSLDWFAVVLFAASLVVLKKTKIPPLAVMLIDGVIGMVFYCFAGQIVL
ncbi:MAG: chromate transporter [Eubacteriaceae bacterium]|nr:chromate transporter [Eubacteriaceae bacterium]